MEKIRKQLTSAQIIILGFAAVILIGALLLMLPISTRAHVVTNFFDALFTSTSAVCVTGLIVQDTATYWSPFGQAIILLLIQIGGMGVITVAVALAAIAGKRIGLKQRSTMQEAISAHKVGGIVKLTGFIIKMTAIFEVLGAVIMSPVFCKEFGIFKGIWYSIFHSISAFCNAGFDLMGCKEKFSSVTSFVGNPIINLTIMALIVTGGIGFLTWEDVIKNKWHIKRYRMQTKIILLTTTLLIFIPAIFFFINEYDYLELDERILASLFQSVSPRTAGFNTVDLTKMSEVGLTLMIMLMVIGGSPGSTAGGMKTTTFAVMLSTAFSVFTHKEHTHFFGRRVEDSVIRHAITLLTLYLVFFVNAGFAISLIEDLPLLTCLFETASAIGTVGLSLGITPALTLPSKLILISLMYFGRVGGLTLIFAAVSTNKASTAKFPQEKLTVG